MGEGTQLPGPPAGLEVEPPGLNRCPHGMLTLQLAVEPIELVSASLEGPVSERRWKPLNSGIVEGAALNLSSYLYLIAMTARKLLLTCP